MLHATSLQSYGAPNFIGGSYAAYAPALNGGGAYGSVGMVGQAGGGGGGGGMMPVMGPMGQQIYSMVGVDGSGNIQWQAQQQPQIQPQAQQLPQPQQQPMLMGYYVVQQPQQQLQPQQHLLQRPVSSAGPANNSDVAKPDATSDQNPSNHSSQSENGGEGARN